MSLWASVFLDFWKRKNAEIAYDWDMMDYHDEEPDRPQFKSKKTRINPVTGLTEKVSVVCVCVCFMCVLCVCVCVFCVCVCVLCACACAVIVCFVC